MKLFSKGPDGGKNSTVQGFWLIEIKSLFSIVLLKFNPGSRENFHSHAFNAFTFWISGEVDEYLIDGSVLRWKPSLKPKYTPRSNFHKIWALQTSYALSFRGPWQNTWLEYRPTRQSYVRLTHGRKVVGEL